MPSVLEPPSLTPMALAGATDLVCLYHPCLLAPYQDASARWHIGWGSTVMPDGSPVQEMSIPITPRAADAMLKRTLLAIGERVLTLVGRPLRNNQAAALVALVYDISAPAFHLSDLLQCLCDGDFPAAAAAFARFVVDDAGRVRSDLVLRRHAQRRYFQSSPAETSA